MGKSACGSAFGWRVALAGRGVMVFSLEISCRQWMARMATEACWGRDLSLPYTAAFARLATSPRTAGVPARRRDSLRGLTVLIEEQSGLTAADIALRTHNGARVLLFTQKRTRLGLVSSVHYFEQKVHEVGEIS
jgi:hypothetical protein